jgi:hypothetical protein
MNRNCFQCGRLLPEFKSFDREIVCKCEIKSKIISKKLDEVIDLLNKLLNKE